MKKRRADTPLAIIIERMAITQAWLVRETGLSAAAISRYVNGRRPDPQSRALIAKALQIHPAELDEDVGLMTEEERRLLDLFRRTPSNAKATVIAVAEAMAQPGKLSRRPDAQPSISDHDPQNHISPPRKK